MTYFQKDNIWLAVSFVLFLTMMATPVYLAVTAPPEQGLTREAEAVERGYAEYVPDPKTRKPVFHWFDKPKAVEKPMGVK